jgi:LmbE family N-acetylglucosaminyl deacetylase
MRDQRLEHPVGVFIFNRPVLAEKMVRLVTKARPPKVMVVADSPRAGHPDDVELCAAARAVVDRVDWDCKVVKDYSGSISVVQSR